MEWLISLYTWISVILIYFCLSYELFADAKVERLCSLIEHCKNYISLWIISNKINILISFVLATKVNRRHSEKLPSSWTIKVAVVVVVYMLFKNLKKMEKEEAEGKLFGVWAKSIQKMERKNGFFKKSWIARKIDL